MNKAIALFLISSLPLISGCKWSDDKTKDQEPKDSKVVVIEDKVVKINSEADLKKLIHSKKPVVLKFETGWCGACKVMEPVYKKAATKFEDVTFVTVDADKFGSVAKEYEILGVPTFIFIKDGKVLEKTVGGLQEDKFFETIETTFK